MVVSDWVRSRQPSFQINIRKTLSVPFVVTLSLIVTISHFTFTQYFQKGKHHSVAMHFSMFLCWRSGWTLQHTSLSLIPRRRSLSLRKQHFTEFCVLALISLQSQFIGDIKEDRDIFYIGG